VIGRQLAAKILHRQAPKVGLVGGLGRLAFIWNDLWKNKPVKQKPKVVASVTDHGSLNP